MPTLKQIVKVFTYIGIVWVAWFSIFLYSIDVVPIANPSNPPPAMTGPLAKNDFLSKSEKIFEGELPGPESFTVFQGKLYTGLNDGRIVRLEAGRVIDVAKLGQECLGRWEGESCGRPYGLRAGVGKDRDSLFFVDPYRGLFKLNEKTGGATALFSADQTINGSECKFLNDLVTTTKGDVYFTDSSTKFKPKESVFTFIERAPTGRVLFYNNRRGQVSVFVPDLFFPTGVEISPNEEFLLVSEGLKFRILKVFLKGSERGRVEVFLDNLPGVPDNIRISIRHTYWVGFNSVHLPNYKNTLELLNPYPSVRRFIGWFVFMVKMATEFTLAYVPWNAAKSFAYSYGYLKLVELALMKYGLVIEISQDGRILRSYHSPDGFVSMITQAEEIDNYLYLGSPLNNFMARVKLNKVWKQPKSAAPAAPVTTPPK